jgi:hypothetical protein
MEVVAFKFVVLGALLFFVVSNPMMYDIVDRYVPVKEAGIPSQVGVVLHALVWVLLFSLLIKLKPVVNTINKVLPKK